LITVTHDDTIDVVVEFVRNSVRLKPDTTHPTQAYVVFAFRRTAAGRGTFPASSRSIYRLTVAEFVRNSVRLKPDTTYPTQAFLGSEIYSIPAILEAIQLSSGWYHCGASTVRESG
jgi:hypothetical protein